MFRKRVITSGTLLLALYNYQSLAADFCNMSFKDYPIPQTILYIDPDMDDGSLLAKAEVNTSGVKGICAPNTKSGKYASSMQSPFNTVVGSNEKGNIYSSGVPGIGLQISDLQKRVNMVPYETNIRYQDLIPWETVGRTTVYFIKTGKISTGTTLKGVVAKYTLDKQNIATVTLSTNLAWTKKSCVVDPGNRNQVVPMPPTSYTVFGGVGTTGPSKNFSVTLDCDENDLPVFVSFEATTGSTGNGILNIDNTVENAAKGVAIEILNRDDSSPLIFDNEVKYHSNMEKVVSIPFVARYKKIATTVTAGTANAAMTFTINQY